MEPATLAALQVGRRWRREPPEARGGRATNPASAAECRRASRPSQPTHPAQNITTAIEEISGGATLFPADAKVGAGGWEGWRPPVPPQLSRRCDGSASAAPGSAANTAPPRAAGGRGRHCQRH